MSGLPLTCPCHQHLPSQAGPERASDHISPRDTMEENINRRQDVLREPSPRPSVTPTHAHPKTSACSKPHCHFKSGHLTNGKTLLCPGELQTQKYFLYISLSLKYLLETRKPHHHFLDVWPWASCLTSLFLQFLLHNIEMIILHISEYLVHTMPQVRQPQSKDSATSSRCPVWSVFECKA